jgi:hypothetical protein
MFILNTTIINPSKIDGKPYFCKIVGDGTIKHWGLNRAES